MNQYQQVSTGALIFNNKNEVLFVKRSEDEEFEAGRWELPGGGSEFGETPEMALKREIKEECGIDIEVFNPLAVKTYMMKKPNEEIQRIEIIFRCSKIKPDQNIILSGEHSEYKFLSLSNLNGIELSPYMGVLIRKIIALNVV